MTKIHAESRRAHRNAAREFLTEFGPVELTRREIAHCDEVGIDPQRYAEGKGRYEIERSALAGTMRANARAQFVARAAVPPATSMPAASGARDCEELHDASAAAVVMTVAAAVGVGSRAGLSRSNDGFAAEVATFLATSTLQLAGELDGAQRARLGVFALVCSGAIEVLGLPQGTYGELLERTLTAQHRRRYTRPADRAIVRALIEGWTGDEAKARRMAQRVGDDAAATPADLLKLAKEAIVRGDKDAALARLVAFEAALASGARFR